MTLKCKCRNYFWYLYRRDSLFGKQFQAPVFQFELLDFAATGHRIGVDKEDILRNLVAGDFAATEILDDIFRHRDTFVQDDEGTDLFALFLRWNGGYLYIFHTV